MVFFFSFFPIVQKEKKDGYSYDIRGFFFDMVQGCIEWQSTHTRLWLRREHCIWSKLIPKYLPIVSNIFSIYLYYFLLLYFTNLLYLSNINK